jgi:Na+/melibiose symporter-like transporter
LEREDLMSNERNGYRTALVLFAVAVIIAMLMAFGTTLERVDKRMANSETAPGTMGLAKARPPLDRAPGQPVYGK